MRVTAAEKQAQIDALEQLKKDGRLTGTHSAYAILKDMFPRGKNPGLKTIGDYMRDKPDLQPHRMPASHAGEKNAVNCRSPRPKSLETPDAGEGALITGRIVRVIRLMSSVSLIGMTG